LQKNRAAARIFLFFVIIICPYRLPNFTFTFNKIWGILYNDLLKLRKNFKFLLVILEWKEFVYEAVLGN